MTSETSHYDIRIQFRFFFSAKWGIRSNQTWLTNWWTFFLFLSFPNILSQHFITPGYGDSRVGIWHWNNIEATANDIVSFALFYALLDFLIFWHCFVLQFLFLLIPLCFFFPYEAVSMFLKTQLHPISRIPHKTMQLLLLLSNLLPDIAARY